MHSWLVTSSVMQYLKSCARRPLSKEGSYQLHFHNHLQGHLQQHIFRQILEHSWVAHQDTKEAQRAAEKETKRML